MGLYKYSVTADKAKVARAQGYDLDISYKDLTNVCAAMRNRSVAKARKVLEDAIALSVPIPFKKFSKGVGHRSQLGGRKGRFPRKECRAALAILNNAVANANRKGFDESLLFVKGAVAYKQNVLPRYRRIWVGGMTLGYGKQATRSDYVTARIEITLEERPELGGKERKGKTGRKGDKAGRAAKAAAPVAPSAPDKAEQKGA